MHFRSIALGLTALALAWTIFAADAPKKPEPKGIVWKRGSEKFDARVRDLDLAKILESIRTQTGWEVYMDPGMKQKISATFKDKDASDAMDLLLGNIRYAIVPGRKGPTKLYVFRDKRDQATKMIAARARKAKPIPNELVVVIKSGEDAKMLARKYNAEIVSSIDKLNAHRLRFKNQNSADFANTQITGNGEGETDSVYGIERPIASENLGNAALPGLKLNRPGDDSANSIVIGMIDTAVQRNNMAHADFLLPSINIAGEASPGNGSPTHGTSMAEAMLRGVSDTKMEASDQPVQILPVDVYGDSPTTTTFDVARGIVEASNAGVDIINLSLGGTGDSKFLHNVIKQSNDAGVLFLAAAGNEPVATPTYPAAYPEIMAVTSVDRRGNIASYANYGNFVDVTAPGSMVIPYNSSAFYVTGTSASSAYLSGVAAGMTSQTGSTPQQVGTAIRTVRAVK